MKLRHFSDYRHTIDFDYLVIVSCPSCHGASWIRTKKDRVKIPERIGWLSAGAYDFRIEVTSRFTCLSCARVTEDISGSLDTDSSKLRFANHDLYLQIPCCGHLLWALNRDHIDFLESYVSAGLRERNIADHNHRSLIANLPKWICLGKNRSEVVRKLRKLRDMTEGFELQKSPTTPREDNQ